jgi:hypothetical protein
MEYGQFTSPFGTVDPHLRDFSDFELPSDEAILEAMTTVCVFFPFGRLSKLTIKETLGLSLAVGST